jgi:hypothetical protein
MDDFTNTKLDELRKEFAIIPKDTGSGLWDQLEHFLIRTLLEYKELLSSEASTEQRTYTQKQLYQFVTEYSREAREEGFDMSVGDFVDWVASREEKVDIDRSDSASFIDPYTDNPEIFPPVSIPDKPVLPEKLKITEPSDKDNPFLPLFEIDRVIAERVNGIIDYLSRKEQ